MKKGAPIAENDKVPHKYSTTIERVLKVLEYLATSVDQDGAGIAEISRDMKIEKGAVYRVLNTLFANGYLVKTERGYRLSSKLVALSSEYLGKIDVVATANPYLRALARDSGEMALLTILEGDSVVLVDKVEGNRNLRIFSTVGSIFPLHCAASGKVFLAHMEPNERREVIARIDFQPLTDRTIVSAEELERHLQQVIDNGYAVNDCEQDYQKRAIAAPILGPDGSMVAAVGIAGPAVTLVPGRFEELGRLARETGYQISKELGYRGHRRRHAAS